MTDQIYYKVQYPIKKAINIIKKVDVEQPFGEEDDFTQEDVQELKNFMVMWKDEGKENLEALIKKLRQI